MVIRPMKMAGLKIEYWSKNDSCPENEFCDRRMSRLTNGLRDAPNVCDANKAIFLRAFGHTFGGFARFVTIT